MDKMGVTVPHDKKYIPLVSISDDASKNKTFKAVRRVIDNFDGFKCFIPGLKAEGDVDLVNAKDKLNALSSLITKELSASDIQHDQLKAIFVSPIDINSDGAMDLFLSPAMVEFDGLSLFWDDSPRRDFSFSGENDDLKACVGGMCHLSQNVEDNFSGTIDVLYIPFGKIDYDGETFDQTATTFHNEAQIVPGVLDFHGAAYGGEPTDVGKVIDRWQDSYGKWARIQLFPNSPKYQEYLEAIKNRELFVSPGAIKGYLKKTEDGLITDWATGEISMVIAKDKVRPKNWYAIAKPRGDGILKAVGIEPPKGVDYEPLFDDVKINNRGSVMDNTLEADEKKQEAVGKQTIFQRMIDLMQQITTFLSQDEDDKEEDVVAETAAAQPSLESAGAGSLQKAVDATTASVGTSAPAAVAIAMERVGQKTGTCIGGPASDIKAQETFGGTPRQDLPDSAFLFPEDRSFPVVGCQDIQDAVYNIGRSSHDADEIKKRLMSRAKEIGCENSLPEAWKQGDNKGVIDMNTCDELMKENQALKAQLAEMETLKACCSENASLKAAIEETKKSYDSAMKALTDTRAEMDAERASRTRADDERWLDDGLKAGRIDPSKKEEILKNLASMRQADSIVKSVGSSMVDMYKSSFNFIPAQSVITGEGLGVAGFGAGVGEPDEDEVVRKLLGHTQEGRNALQRTGGK